MDLLGGYSSSSSDSETPVVVPVSTSTKLVPSQSKTPAEEKKAKKRKIKAVLPSAAGCLISVCYFLMILSFCFTIDLKLVCIYS